MSRARRYSKRNENEYKLEKGCRVPLRNKPTRTFESQSAALSAAVARPSRRRTARRRRRAPLAGVGRRSLGAVRQRRGVPGAWSGVGRWERSNRISGASRSTLESHTALPQTLMTVRQLAPACGPGAPPPKSAIHAYAIMAHMRCTTSTTRTRAPGPKGSASERTAKRRLDDPERIPTSKE